MVRIALTGGPCAGKSSCLTSIINAGKKEGFDVYAGPETATLLMNCGIRVPETVEGLHVFQVQIFQTQLRMEDALTAIVADTGRPSIIIFDRGIMDGRAYIPDDVWHKVLRAWDSERSIEEIEEELLGRYDAVIHMVTAADGAPRYYKYGFTFDDLGKPVGRQETPEEAVKLDARMWEVWEGHKRHMRIANPAGGFRDKLRNVAKSVITLARDLSPSFVGGSDFSIQLSESMRDALTGGTRAHSPTGGTPEQTVAHRHTAI